MYENKNYKVEVRESSEPDHKGITVYAVVNKATGVVEMEHTILPHIINYAMQLNESLENIFSSDKEEWGKEHGGSAKDLLVN